MAARNKRITEVWSRVETLLGEPVIDIKTPGGSARASCRVVLNGRTIIATKRPNFRRTTLEAEVLKRLSPVCSRVPQFIKMDKDLLLQSDVGGERLSQAVRKADNAAAISMTTRAVEAIFEIQSAAKTQLHDLSLPPLGVSQAWLDGLVNAVSVLEIYSPGLSQRIDHQALLEALAVAPNQFVKWDCRSGNAAIDMAGSVSWFDFEYCGMRHGAEDIAWLIADESFPVKPADMFDIAERCLPAKDFGSREAYLEYLALYTTFHALRRLELVINETKRRGWRSKSKVIERDDVGRHPEFGAHICSVGAYFANMSTLTQSLVVPFKLSEANFEAIAKSS